MRVDIKYLDELSSQEATTIFQERVAVFVVEQNCPYQEIDIYDFQALHLRLFDNDALVAYSRIIDKKEHITFGRIMVKKDFRNLSYGRRLLNETLAIIHDRFPNLPIKISAQVYLQHFYESFGFKPISDTYLEDNIPHIDMVLTKEDVLSIF